MKLPEGFVTKMRDLLKDEAESFFATYDKPKTSGLRSNGLKLDGQALSRLSAFARAPIPWSSGAFYTDVEDRPGKHPHYHLGLYYIQEPSAMFPAELLGVLPGHRVLDLCAAPGGKTTQLAAKLQGTGVLVTNDNASERTKALAKNVELSGVRNAVVLNEEPKRIADAFGSWFDRVLVDAPCSGEGMFRKDEDMIRQWTPETVERYSVMQREIMRDAARLVAPGGRLVYSTCTFSPEENEGTTAWFLAEFPEFQVVPYAAPAHYGFATGRPDWLRPEDKRTLSVEKLVSIAGAVRIWPHHARGEGHYAVLLERKSADRPRVSAGKLPATAGRDADGVAKSRSSKGRAAIGDADVLDKFEAFRKMNLPEWLAPGRLIIRGNMAYAQPEELPSVTGLHALRPGWLLGAANKHRFEPSQSLAMGLSCDHAARRLQLSSHHTDSLRYLKGETLQPAPGQIEGRGWTLVCIDGYPAGWGRWDGMTLKNERLPGWRWL